VDDTSWTKDELDELRTRFHRSLQNNLVVFGKHAFRKRGPGDRRKPLNMALFEVFSVLLADHPEDSVKAHAKELRDGFSELMNDLDFIAAISNATSSVPRVQTRFSKASAIISRVLDA
jgi:hypothetical protein